MASSSDTALPELSSLPPGIQSLILGFVDSDRVRTQQAAEKEALAPATVERLRAIASASDSGSSTAASAAPLDIGSLVDSLRRDHYAVADGVLGGGVAGGARREAARIALGEEGDGLAMAAMKVGALLPTRDAAKRGDWATWVSLAQIRALGGAVPSLEAVLVLMEGLRCRLNAALGTGTPLRLERSSVMLAMYPGHGSRYVRHLDAPNKAQQGAVAASSAAARRRITVLYYLNPGWTSADGGQLRLYGRPAADEEASVDVDVGPVADRLVLFRSGTVEHEVLPTSDRFVRFAVTGWFYADDDPLDPVDDRTPTTAPPTATAPPTTCTIFVSVVSYRDPQCPRTVADCLARAAHPERVRIGVVSQHDARVDTACWDPAWHKLRDPAEAVPSDAPVRLFSLPHTEAKGPCHARHLAQQLWRGETHYLQVDAHMRFVEGWDALLLSQLAACPNSDRAVLSTYPADFAAEDGEEAFRTEQRPTLLCPTHFADQDGLVRIAGRLLLRAQATPIPCHFVAAGFLFGPSSVIQCVPYDRHLPHVFFGEEQTLALRLWTSGFDLFAPTRAVVYHRWSRAGRPSVNELPRDEAVRATAMARVRHLLGMVGGAQQQDGKGAGAGAAPTTTAQLAPGVALAELDTYGLGTARTRSAYYRAAGINPANQTITAEAIRGGLSEGSFALAPAAGHAAR